jgi:hypothetical protein
MAERPAKTKSNIARRLQRSGLDRREFVCAGVMMFTGAAFAASAGMSDALKAAADTLGAATTKTLQFIAAGAGFTVGQNFTPNDPWPRVAIKQYTASIDYESGSMLLDLVREMGARMPRGGGVPFTGELHQIQAVSGKHAWNAPVSNPPPGGGAGPASDAEAEPQNRSILCN